MYSLTAKNWQQQSAGNGVYARPVACSRNSTAATFGITMERIPKKMDNQKNRSPLIGREVYASLSKIRD